MSGPLHAAIQNLSEASSARHRAPAATAQRWVDTAFRAVGQRALIRLEQESRLALSAMDAADERLRDALRLLED